MKFRKKSIAVEAFQMTRERRFGGADWPEWLREAWNKKEGTPGSLYPAEAGSAAGTLLISTLEGQFLVLLGDWIIRGVKGELYPVKNDIFLQTYEPVDKVDTIDDLLSPTDQRKEKIMEPKEFLAENKLEEVMCAYECEQCGAGFQDKLYPDDPDNTLYCPACRMDFVCPFCHEKDFDKVGLKVHLQNYCKIFDKIDITRRIDKILIGGEG